ncbi:FAS-associated factor 2 [Harmonia axyridis]|uniref:FAS-associated factor 2 n=1 Tax=Harmonia axyridis TaxID=115357 RepID=UPI001E2750D8|nr:FAS-associated factor 2 [Harmonia axyridis]
MAMDFMRDNASLGLTSDQTEKVLQFQDLTGIEDITVCRDVLQRHQWNLEVAVQEQLNMREGRPSVYASESRPPAVVTDHLGQHIYYTPPSDGSGSGLRGFIQNLIGFFYNICYNTIITFLQIGQRLLGIENQRRIEPLQEVIEFIQEYDEKICDTHPVFYQGTFSQVLNDAKRELRFLLVYLHNSSYAEAEKFCRETLSNTDVITYVNTQFMYWACTVNSQEGRRVKGVIRMSTFPSVCVLVLKEGRMTVVGRVEGFHDSNTLLQRLRTIVSDFEVNLIQARSQRFEASLNRSIRATQDEAYQESLKADQEKERRREEERRFLQEQERQLALERQAEEERRESIAKEKIESVSKVPNEPDPSDPDAVHVVFKLPCGLRLDRRFLKTHSLEVVFYFVFCHPKAPDSFEITTNFPKRVLNCRPKFPGEKVLTIEEAGLRNKEVLFISDLDA